MARSETDATRKLVKVGPSLVDVAQMALSSIPLEPRTPASERPSSLATCVVGTDPAALLFCLVAGIWRQELAADIGAWPIVLIDLAEESEHPVDADTDSLPFDRHSWLGLRDEIDDPLFDEFVALLEAERFRPGTGTLRSALFELAARVGIQPMTADAGDGETADTTGDTAEVDVRQLLARSADVRSLLADNDLLTSDMTLTVVVADPASLLAAGASTSPTGGADHHVVSLRVEGDGLPDRLHRRRHRALAHLQGSILEYWPSATSETGARAADVDVFIPRIELASVARVEPGDPVVVTPTDAPFLAAVVDRLSNGLTADPNVVTFRSSEAVRSRCAARCARLEGGATATFLLGPSAISLPYLRSSAALAASIESLATTHAGLAVTCGSNHDLALAVESYEMEMETIWDDEIEMVDYTDAALTRRAESALTNSRMPLTSSLLPNAVLTSPAPDREPEPLNARLALVALGVVLATALAVAMPMIGLVGAALAVLVQAASGAAYRSHLDETSPPNRTVAGVSVAQVSALLVAAIVTGLVDPAGAEPALRLAAGVMWFVLPVTFAWSMSAVTRWAIGVPVGFETTDVAATTDRERRPA